MDPIKEAFSKIKEDIIELKKEIYELRSQINQKQTIPTHNSSIPIQQTDIQTQKQTIPTHNYPIQTLYTQNSSISIGNDGVPTDRQTHQPTHQPTQNLPKNNYKTEFDEANDILLSLDTIKKEIRLKFKRLTPQEMLVFSTLYSLEDEKTEEITYRTIAIKLRLSESSIRDYINKLIKKGVPIDKIRQNNKTILLKVSQNLRNIATLATIQNLREL